MKKSTARLLLCLTALLFSAGIVWAGPATEILRPPMDTVFKILSDPRYKDAAGILRQEQREKLWQNIKGMFDFL